MTNPEVLPLKLNCDLDIMGGLVLLAIVPHFPSAQMRRRHDLYDKKEEPWTLYY
jgi:hypothetical protein